MPVMGGRTGKDGKRQMGLAIAFIICGLLTSITLQIVVGTVLLEEIQKMRGEMTTLSNRQYKIMLKQCDMIQAAGDIQNKQLKIVLDVIQKRMESEKKISKCYEDIESMSQLALNHAQAVVDDNERLRRENAALANKVFQAERR